MGNQFKIQQYKYSCPSCDIFLFASIYFFDYPYLLNTKKEYFYNEKILYKDLCNETMLASLSSKVPNLDLGVHIDRDSDISMIETVKTKLSSTLTPKVLSDVVITPLAKETFEKNEKFIVPVLLKSRTKQGKAALDKALKTKGLDVNFHWPKQLFPIIKSLREKYQNVKSEDIDLTSKQILIRPSATGKSIMVSYRTRIGTNWTFLESFKTPAPQAMLENTKFLQPFSSKYIQM